MCVPGAVDRDSVSVAPSPHGVKVSASGRTVTSFRDYFLDEFLGGTANVLGRLSVQR
jgi:hypothetical protein